MSTAEILMLTGRWAAFAVAVVCCPLFWVLGRNRERVRQTVEIARRNAELAARPARYELPAAPVTGRTVVDKHGQYWRRVNPPLDWSYMPQWGAWQLLIDRTDDVTGGDVTSWPWLLEFGGPLFLEALTVKERATERVYGPMGGRWGNPGEPCPYSTCVLGVGHIPPHIDREGKEIPTPSGALEVLTGQVPYCDCGRPSNHRPTCPRFRFMTGTATPPQETPDV